MREFRPHDFFVGIVRHRWWVLAVWIALAALLGPAAARVEHALDVSARVDGSESAEVDAILERRFASPFARYAVLVARGVPSPAERGGDSSLARIVRDLRLVPGVTGTVSYLDARDTLFVDRVHEGTFLIVGIEPHGGAPDVMMPPLRQASDRIATALRGRYPRATLQWTGDIALNYDLRQTSATQAASAERRVLPLTLVMLVVAFGTLVAALVPMVVAGIAITLTLGTAVAVTSILPLSILLQNIVTMLGLGLGIDYALLMVSRFREEMAAGHAPHAAAARAAHGAGHTIMLSAVAVLIGFGALLLIPLSELRSVAVGGALVVIAAGGSAVIALPAALALLGGRVDIGQLPRALRAAPNGGTRWRRWAGWVAARPLVVLLVGGAPLAALALQAKRIDTSLPRVNWLPTSMESARALTDLVQMHRAGVVHALRVVVELPAGHSVLERDGWNAVARASRVLAADGRVARVQSLPSVSRIERPSLTAVSLLPAELVATFTSRDQRAAVIEVIPNSALDFPALTRFVRDLRGRDAASLTGIAGTRILIGGMPAFNADYEDAIAGRLWLVIGLVIGGTFVALAIGFRSVLVPLKALVLNLLSVAASLGAVVLVFQDGHGAALIGVSTAMGSLFPALPVLVFCIVFGLSMDYEVFLVARVREARRRGSDEGAALAEGLARTGGVITSAAAIMIVVFAAFTLGEFLMIKVLGFALAVAVLLDATVVRLAIGPALLRLAGGWNWWPGEPAPPKGSLSRHRAAPVTVSP